MRPLLLLLVMRWFVTLQPLVAVAHADDWVNASQALLQQMYTKHDYCVLTNADPSSMCKKKTGNVVESKCSALTKQENVRHRENLPQSMYHVPKEFANSQETSSLIKLTDMFITLNQTNKVIMLIGDSITRNSIEALVCLLSIEYNRNGKGNKMIDISPPVEKVLYGGTKYTITLPYPLPGDLTHIVSVRILYFAVWTPYANGAGAMYLKEANRLMKNEDPSTGIVFVFNIGMHEKHEPTQTKHVMDMIHFAQKNLLSMERRQNLFLYRESSAQHYNSTAGYFNIKQSQAWKLKKMPLPTCVPYSTVANDKNDWRYNGEQGAFKMTQFPTSNIIPFRHYSRHFFDVHSSSPFFKTAHQKVGPDRDCTHFNPVAAPVLYRILWFQILQRALQGPLPQEGPFRPA